MSQSMNISKGKVYLGPKVIDPVKELDSVTLTHNTSLMKRRFTASLHWYVNQSLTDFLEDYMQIDEHTLRLERQRILNHIVELPINHDQTTRQLFVTQVLATIQREMVSSKTKCLDLIIGIFRRLDPKKSDVSSLLLKDFELLLDHVYFENAKQNEENSTSRKSQRKRLGSSDLDRVREAIGYTQILIKIFRLGFFRNKKVPILVVLNKLSLQKPSTFFANILIFILKEVGPCIIEDSRGACGDRSSMFNPPTGGFEKDTPTIDNVLQRAPAFFKFLPSQSENVAAIKKLIEDRKHLKRFPFVKIRTRSRSGSNGTTVTFNLDETILPQRRNGTHRVHESVTTVSAGTNTENDELIEDQAPVVLPCMVGAEVAEKEEDLKFEEAKEDIDDAEEGEMKAKAAKE